MSELRLLEHPILGLYEQSSTQFSGDKIKFKKIRCSEIFNLQIKSDDHNSFSLVESKLKVKLPQEPNTTEKIKDFNSTIFWLGPYEWLFVSHDNSNCLDKFMLSECRKYNMSWTDISDSRIVISLSGYEAQAVLEKGCPLDFHHDVFLVNSCAQSLIGQASVLIHRISCENVNESSWMIYTDLSYAAYLWAWLNDAVSEYI